MEQITRRQFLKRVFAYGSIGLVAAYPIFIERNIVLTNIYRIPVPNLPKNFSGFRVVHLTDFHYGPLVSLKFIRNVVE
jgi:predicted MPP superfamily phosphohydrolase